MSVAERYEAIVTAFERNTGYMAPDKDVPPEMAYTDMQQAERSSHWKTFCAGFSAGFLHADALARAKGEA